MCVGTPPTPTQAVAVQPPHPHAAVLTPKRSGSSARDSGNAADEAVSCISPSALALSAGMHGLSLTSHRGSAPSGEQVQAAGGASQVGIGGSRLTPHLSPFRSPAVRVRTALGAGLEKSPGVRVAGRAAGMSRSPLRSGNVSASPLRPGAVSGSPLKPTCFAPPPSQRQAAAPASLSARQSVGVRGSFEVGGSGSGGSAVVRAEASSPQLHRAQQAGQARQVVQPGQGQLGGKGRASVTPPGAVPSAVPLQRPASSRLPGGAVHRSTDFGRALSGRPLGSATGSGSGSGGRGSSAKVAVLAAGRAAASGPGEQAMGAKRTGAVAALLATTLPLIGKRAASARPSAGACGREGWDSELA